MKIHERSTQLVRLASRPVFLLNDVLGILSFAGSQFMPESWKSALTTIGSACLTIGVALPISLFYQLKAEAEMMSIVDACHRTGIKAIFENRLSHKLRPAVDSAAARSIDIKLLGVALGVLFDPTVPYSDEIQAQLDDPGVRVRVLLLHPDSKAALLRNEIEKGNSTLRKIENTIHHGIPATIQVRLARAGVEDPELQRAIAPNRDGGNPPSELLERIVKAANFEVRLYDNDPIMHLMIFRDSIFHEQYHLGRPKDARAASCIGQHTPVTEYSTSAVASAFYMQHFEAIWDRADDVTGEVVKTALANMQDDSRPPSRITVASEMDKNSAHIRHARPHT